MDDLKFQISAYQGEDILEQHTANFRGLVMMLRKQFEDDMRHHKSKILLPEDYLDFMSRLRERVIDTDKSCEYLRQDEDNYVFPEDMAQATTDMKQAEAEHEAARDNLRNFLELVDKDPPSIHVHLGYREAKDTYKIYEPAQFAITWLGYGWLFAKGKTERWIRWEVTASE